MFLDRCEHRLRGWPAGVAYFCRPCDAMVTNKAVEEASKSTVEEVEETVEDACETEETAAYSIAQLDADLEAFYND